MTNSNKATTPFLPSTSTGGEDPTRGKGNPDINGQGGIVALPVTGEKSSTSFGTYANNTADGCGYDSMMSVNGPNGAGPDLTTMSNTNADVSGKTSMIDMSGPRDTVSPKAMNADGDHFAVDRTGNPMGRYENMAWPAQP